MKSFDRRPANVHARVAAKSLLFGLAQIKEPAWVRVEDIPAISKEWADEMLRRDIERRRETGIEGLDPSRHNIREWVKSGVVKSSKLRSADDEDVCEACKQISGRISLKPMSKFRL